MSCNCRKNNVSHLFKSSFSYSHYFPLDKKYHFSHYLLFNHSKKHTYFMKTSGAYTNQLHLNTNYEYSLFVLVVLTYYWNFMPFCVMWYFISPLLFAFTFSTFLTSKHEERMLALFVNYLHIFDIHLFSRLRTDVMLLFN